MGISYEKDIVLWANEQAMLLRSRNFSAIDIEHIAEEIEDVGRSEKNELANRMALLLAHLLKWKYQPGRRGSSWQRTIKEQRNAIAKRLDRTPSLLPVLRDHSWQSEIWSDAVSKVIDETGIDVFPEVCLWSVEEFLDSAFFPE